MWAIVNIIGGCNMKTICNKLTSPATKYYALQTQIIAFRVIMSIYG